MPNNLEEIKDKELFNEEIYLRENPDVREAVVKGVLRSGYEHWHHYGRFEGRGATWKVRVLNDNGSLIEPDDSLQYTETSYDTRPKVGFLTPGMQMGGAERWILSLVKNFTRIKPYSLLNVFGDYDKRLYKEISKYLRIFTNKKMPIEASLIRSALMDCDIVISWGIYNLPEITRGLSIPVVEVSHSDPRWETPVKMLKTSYVGATHFVGVSNNAAKSFPLSIQNKVVTIYNGVEPERVFPRIGRTIQRERWGFTEKDKVVLFLGRLCPQKNPLKVLGSLEYLSEEYKLVFSGNGELKNEAHLIAKRFPNRVLFVQPSVHVGDYLAAADVLALPSEYEGMPLVLLEAWMAGLPTVTTTYASYLELENKHGRLSLTVDTDFSLKDLATQLDIAVKQGRESSLVKKSQSLVLEEYNSARMAYNWECYLMNVLHTTPSKYREE